MAHTTLIFGDSGSFKTTAIGHAARYVFKRTGKRTRVLTVESGWTTLRKLVDAGMVEVFHFGSFPYPLPLLRKLAMGYWPEKIDPREGVMIGTRLVAPTPQTWQQIGLVAFEGLTSMGELLMRDQTAKGRTIGGEDIGGFTERLTVVDVAGKDQPVDEKFAYNTRNHYGFCQNELLARVVSLGGLPCERVIISAHEAKGEEEDTRRAIRGPALPGKAATSRVLKDVGDVLHFETYTEERELDDPSEKGKKIRTTETRTRVFYLSHPDPMWAGTGIPILYKCKPRMSPEAVAELQKVFPGGFFHVSPESGLDRYFELQDRLAETGAGEVRAQMEKWEAERKSREAQAQVQPAAPTVSAVQPK